MSDETTPAGIELVLAALRQRTEKAEAEAAKLRGWDESLSGRMAKDLADAKARAEQAEVALEAADDLAAGQLQDYRAEIAEAEVQIRTADAAIARVRALATNATRTECGAGWDLNPSEVLTALDQPEEAAK